MSKLIRLSALALALGSLVWWLGTGAHRGWTKTSVPTTIVDPVTGIEGIEYEKRFVPGLDALGAALLGAGVLAGVSCFVTKRKRLNAPE